MRNFLTKGYERLSTSCTRRYRFTKEYSVCATKIAVYTLLGLNKKVCPVTPHRYKGIEYSISLEINIKAMSAQKLIAFIFYLKFYN